MVEYIGLNPVEQIYAKKNLLYCEMSLLESVKIYRRYKEIRKQSVALSALLKRILVEIQDELRKFESMLPKTKYDKFRAADISIEKKKRQELEEEIAQIKRKIAELSQI